MGVRAADSENFCGEIHVLRHITPYPSSGRTHRIGNPYYWLSALNHILSLALPLDWRR